MSTIAPDNRKDFTIVNGPSRKRLSTIQVCLDIAEDNGHSAPSKDCSVNFELRDWNGTGEKSHVGGKKIRRRVVITDINWRSFDIDGVVAIKGIMSRGIRMFGLYEPTMRQGELHVEGSENFLD